MGDGTMDNKYLFEKLLEREDKFIVVIENLDKSINNLKDPISELKEVVKDHEFQADKQREHCNKAHETLKEEIQATKKGDRTLINLLFKIAFILFCVIVIGKELIGAELIKAFIHTFILKGV